MDKKNKETFKDIFIKQPNCVQTVPNNTITEDWIDMTLATISNCDLLYFRPHRN